MKNEIRNRGHWLAKAMLTGPGRKQRDLGYGPPLFDGERKRITADLTKPRLPEIEKNSSILDVD